MWHELFRIGVAGDAGVRALGQEDKIFVGMMLILIFSEALGLYGLIVSLILSSWLFKVYIIIIYKNI